MVKRPKDMRVGEIHRGRTSAILRNFDFILKAIKSMGKGTNHSCLVSMIAYSGSSEFLTFRFNSYVSHIQICIQNSNLLKINGLLESLIHS